MSMDKLKNLSPLEQAAILNNLHPLSAQSVARRFKSQIDREETPIEVMGERILVSEAFEKLLPILYKDTFSVWVDNNAEVFSIDGKFYSYNEFMDVLHTHELLNAGTEMQVAN